VQCSPLPDVPAPFFFMARVGGWLLFGEGEGAAWCAAKVCSVPSVWAEGILLDGVRGLNWNGVTTHAHFQSFLLFRIFVQSRIPFMSPTQTDWWTFKSHSQQCPWQCVVLCMFIAILMPFLNSSESVAPLWCGHILACIILPWPDDRLKLSRAFGNAGRWAAGLDAGV
jgi:hypothetical protein